MRRPREAIGAAGRGMPHPSNMRRWVFWTRLRRLYNARGVPKFGTPRVFQSQI
ncbi:MAG TPA: hypothetical protein VGB55_16080 [Tepidisphaeraceae bacterium]